MHADGEDGHAWHDGAGAHGRAACRARGPVERVAAAAEQPGQQAYRTPHSGAPCMALSSSLVCVLQLFVLRCAAAIKWCFPGFRISQRQRQDFCTKQWSCLCCCLSAPFVSQPKSCFSACVTEFLGCGHIRSNLKGQAALQPGSTHSHTNSRNRVT